MARNAANPKHHPRARGFTLVEMAMVIVIAGLVIMIVYPALNVARMGAQQTLTETNLHALLRATAVYAQANGCLPCPTPAEKTGPDFGKVRGDGAATAACGKCDQPEGIVPFASMGLPESMARDGWGRWITMRIDPDLANPPNPENPPNAAKPFIVPPTAPCQCADFAAGNIPAGCTTSGTALTGCAVLGASQKGLCRAVYNASKNPLGLKTDDRIVVKTPSGADQYAAVLFLSHGPSGRGAFVAGTLSTGTNGERLPVNGGPVCTGSGGYKTCNLDGNTVFYNASKVSGGTDPFDDTLVFLDRNNLVSLLGNGGCQTSWPEWPE